MRSMARQYGVPIIYIAYALHTQPSLQEFFEHFIIIFQDLKTILDSAEHGVIYFSLGSVVKSSKMPRETVSLLLSALSKLKQTVLWKWEDDQLPNLPKNVMVKKWFPQNDILGMCTNTYFEIQICSSRVA